MPEAVERDDRELARDAQAGSLAAFDELVRRHEGRIYGFILRRVNTVSDAEDLTQQTFVTAYRRLHRYSPVYPFTAWLFTIARRLTISHYRHAATLLETTEVIAEPVDPRTPDAALASREDAENLWALARRLLTERQYSVLWLHYAEDLPVADVARSTGLFPTHVKVLLHRARRALQRILTESADGHGLPALRPVPVGASERRGMP